MAISLKYTHFHKESTNTEEGKKQLSDAQNLISQLNVVGTTLDWFQVLRLIYSSIN